MLRNCSDFLSLRRDVEGARDWRSTGFKDRDLHNFFKRNATIIKSIVWNFLSFCSRGTTEIHRVTQTRTDQDRPGQTRTDLIKRTFGTLFGTLKVLFDQLRSFLGTKLDLFGFLKVILDQLLVTKSFLKISQCTKLVRPGQTLLKGTWELLRSFWTNLGPLWIQN